jgi:4-carboxymuconolactone decarboxylase
LSPHEEAELEATIQTIAGTHGYISNIMQTLALAPKGLAGFAALSAYTCYGSQLSPLQRELATLIAVRDVHYGWTHHEPLARAVGLTEDQLLRIRDGRIPKDLGPAEQALCDYAFEITAQRRVPQRVAEAMHDNFSPRQIVDIALLTAFSMAVAALALGLEVPLEPAETLKFEQDWQQSRST